ncbi:MAG: hypothetical protein WCS31_12760 [Verrucomicrobiae bacterium]
MKLRIAIVMLAASCFGVLTSVHAESDYVVVASNATIQDPAWKKVADALLQKHHGELVTYDGSVKQSLATLRKLHPLYTCFVAKPKSVTQQYVADIHQLTRKYNDDPFCDTFWGILTGYDAANALTIAQNNEPLTVRKVIANTDIAYEMVDEAIVYDEQVQNRMIRKKSGKAPVTMEGPDDTTQAMVEALNEFAPDLIVSSSHATEGDWQLAFSYPNGQFKSKAGKMTGYDTDDKEFPVSSPNPKVYLPVGNCLMGHINNSNAMALAWMNSVGVYQMIGYIFETWYGYAGWGCLDYFVEQPGRYTLAEAFRANDCSLIQRLLSYAPQAATVESELSENPEYHGKLTARARQDGITKDDVEGLLFDRDVLAFYGDPKWEARMADAPKAWNQSLTESNGIYTFTVQPNRGLKSFEPVNRNGSQRGGRPLVEFFPQRLKDFSLLDGADLNPVFTDGFLLVPNPGTCDPSKKYVVRFKANRMTD